jgi:uncharacterized protein YbjT (DUF2867 family)
METLAEGRFPARMTDHTTSPHVLVLGGTGKTGRRIAALLAARGVRTRIGSRSGRPPFDWDDRSTWPAALAGTTAAYISYYPDLAVPGAPDAVGALARVAAGLGVERLVLLSGRGELEAQRSEQAVRDAGVDTTILRASWFNQNFSEHFLLDGVLEGEVALPVNGVREPFVDADDIAEVAVAALTEDGHAGQLYELTGPRLLTFAEATSEIAEAAGRPIGFVEVSLAEYLGALVKQGVPEHEAGLVAFLFSEVLDGRNESLADGVQRALGRSPRDFRDYARAAAASGVWSGGA